MKVRNLDEIKICLHPNSKGLEKKFFKNFKFVNRNNFNIHDLANCDVCWSPASDALINMVANKVESIVITMSNLPKNALLLSFRKAKMLGIDCVDLKNKSNLKFTKNIYPRIFKKIFFDQLGYEKREYFKYY